MHRGADILMHLIGFLCIPFKFERDESLQYRITEHGRKDRQSWVWQLFDYFLAVVIVAFMNQIGFTFNEEKNERY